MKRRALNIVVVLSLLPPLAAALLWAWGYDTWRAGPSRGQFVLVLTGGASAESYIRFGRREGWDAGAVFRGLRDQPSRSAPDSLSGTSCGHRTRGHRTGDAG